MLNRPERSESMRKSQRGLSVVEGLAAMSLLASVALFSLQPFASVLSVVMKGREATTAAVIVGSEMDILNRLPGTLDPLALDTGTSKAEKTFYLAAGETQFSETRPDNGLRWVLDVDVTQHNLVDLEAGVDGLSNLDTPLAEGTGSSFVHIKQISMTLRSSRQGGAYGAGLNQHFVMLRAP